MDWYSKERSNWGRFKNEYKLIDMNARTYKTVYKTHEDK